MKRFWIYSQIFYSYRNQIAFRPLWQDLFLTGLTTDSWHGSKLTNLPEVDLNWTCQVHKHMCACNILSVMMKEVSEAQLSFEPIQNLMQDIFFPEFLSLEICTNIHSPIVKYCLIYHGTTFILTKLLVNIKQYK